MNENTTDAAMIFGPLWKRKWLILAVALLVGAGTYFYYKRQKAVYQATTQLYLGGAAEQTSATGNQGKVTLSSRAVSDQVGLINSAIIGETARKRLRAEHLPQAAKGKARAAANASSDFITITTEAHTPKAAKALANGYARAYIERQRADYLRHIRAQIVNDRQQLRRIETPVAPPTKGKGVTVKGSSTSSTLQAASLQSKISQLETQLSTFSGVQQVGKAKSTPLPLSPAPKKNAIFGFVLGLLLASIAAYVLSRFDRRLRALAEVERVFGAQILAALPRVRSPVVRPGGERAPARALVEPLRRLNTALQMVDVPVARGSGGPRVIVFVSADGGDGRSTLVANLARVQSDGGERVAVVEADFRRPSLGRLLDVHAPRGLADVLAGGLTYRQAMQTVAAAPLAGAAPPPVPSGDSAISTVAEPRSVGTLSVLLSGGATPNPPALLSSPEMRDLLQALAEEYDRVLIDAPSPLEVSDVMPLLPAVDGIVLVARIGHTRDTSAQRLTQVLGRSPSAPVLGAVANCVPRKDIERYGFTWAPAPPGRRKLIGR